MNTIKLILISVLLGSTLVAAMGTFAGLGAQGVEHPEGISLKDESIRRGGFFVYYAGRYHRGGGLRGGK